MGKQFLLCILFLCALFSTGNGQALFTYGPYKVDKKEFIAAYKKNNAGSLKDSAAVKQYLDLYIRYKLKVRAAYEMKLDTLPQLRIEFGDFCYQLAKSYLVDDGVMNALVSEALANSTRDIRISHIYIPYTGSDSAAARDKAGKAMSQLRNGDSFESVALSFSEDAGVRENKGDLGWITTFTLPYALEQLAYQTALNENSALYKSTNAYHLFRRTAERPAAGRIQVAQILFAVPAGSPGKQRDSVMRQADSVYNALKNGADFAQLALAYSADDATYNNQGLLEAFEPGTYSPAFEDQAYSLSADGDITRPFETSRGIHILKRIITYPYTADTTDEQVRASMKARVLNDARSKLATSLVLATATKAIGFKRGPATDVQLENYCRYYFGIDPATGSLADNMQVASSRSRVYYIQDLKDYLSSWQGPYTKGLAEKFLEDMVLVEYQQTLEKYNPEFAAQVNEFRDGNLLFEAMQRKVWAKAGSDDAVLRKYYKDHAGKYKWKESVDAVIFTAADASQANNFRQQLNASPSEWKKLLQENEATVQAESGRYETDELATLESNSNSFVHVLKKHPAGEARSFEDSRGLVLNDYQLQLENEWINSLKKQFPIKISIPVLRSIYR
ncbi:peptidylprolyl isomerase [Flavihumibacter solisilvae]|uniref:PpiC domain-containing protein n=1 Tax=Flavihumibacter solisilvae TaxID=1349421 RepID=A0A0C1ILQ3_9BACT|nr:peptidylprolyl isomerase [Flavihumibacter solisilvae]KIC95175.1 hypothetical protein OI18_07645 [Flavihumibacter solisilvae]